MMFGGTGWGAGMLFGGIFMILFWVFLVAGVIWLVLSITHRVDQPLDRSSSSNASASNASAILDERLARGEIDVEEYKARKAAIGGSR